MSHSPNFNLLFPEWQGYGLHNEVYHGGRQLCHHLESHHTFTVVDVPEHEDLSTTEDIVGLSSYLPLLRTAQHALKTADPSHIFTIGGTCACELAPVAHLNRRYDGDLTVLWFDAHADLNTPATSPSHRLHGMALRTLLGEGHETLTPLLGRALTPQQLTLIGARDLDPAESQFITEHRIPTVSVASPNSMHVMDLVQSAGHANVYIHIDLDVLDPVAFPHVLVPSTDGMSVNTLVRTLHDIQQKVNVVGASVVEYCPKGGGDLATVLRILHEGLGIRHD